MTQINPFTGAIIQGSQLQGRQISDKDRQIRRAQNLAKNSALQGDQLEHQVESADALHATNDSRDSYQQQRRPPSPHRNPTEPEPPEEEPHIDLTA
jgi:hypothetical protein